MPGGIWEAIGAALQSGSNTYRNATLDQDAQRRANAQLRMQQEEQARQAEYQQQQVGIQREQLDMGKRRFAAEEEDRRRKILESAIEGMAPNAVADEKLLSSVKTSAPDLMARFDVQPGRVNTKIAAGLSAPTPENPLGLQTDSNAVQFSPGQATRRATLEEQAKQVNLDTAKDRQTRADQIMAAFSSGKLRDTPANRALLAEFTHVAPNEVWGAKRTVGGEGLGTGNTSDLVQRVVEDPTGRVYNLLPAALRTKIAPALASAGYKFPTAPSEEALNYKRERDVLVKNVASELLPEVSAWTTGLGSSITGHFPGTPAYNFGAKLKTLKANIAFAELTAMRNASKTGGALGQVSDAEGQLLANSRVALEQAQSEDQMRAELQKLIGGLDELDQQRAEIMAREGVRFPQAAPSPEDAHTKALREKWGY